MKKKNSKVAEKNIRNLDSNMPKLEKKKKEPVKKYRK